jgi:hypothetical protein
MRSNEDLHTPTCQLTEARRRAADIAQASLRADAAWQQVYGETFSRVYDQTLAELLAERPTSEAAA